MTALTLVRLLVALCLLLNTATLTACLLLGAFPGQAPMPLTPLTTVAIAAAFLSLRSLRGA